MVTFRPRAAAALCWLVLCWPSAHAQTAPADPARERNAARQYDAAVVGLGRVLGEAHYLRTLCGGDGDQRWRDAMVALMAREGTRRRALEAAFNAGYLAGQGAHPACNPAALRRELTLRADGGRLAETLAARHEE